MSGDVYIALILVVGTLFLGLICSRMAPRRSVRIKATVLGVVYFLYSGAGIAYVENPGVYVLPYFFFLAMMYGGLLFATRVRRNPVDVGDPEGTSMRWWSSQLSTLLAATFVLGNFAQVLASGRAVNLLSPSTVILQGSQGAEVFQGRMELAENSVFAALSYLILLSTPFFYIELQRRLNRRWLSQLLILVAMTYVHVTATGQWGRVTLLQPVIVWTFILLLRGRVSGWQASAGIAGAALIAIPVLNFVAEWRKGGGVAEGTYGSQLRLFRESELAYPELYEQAKVIGAGSNYASEYLHWLITLPIPFAGPSFSATRDFSEALLGISYGMPGFYVLLPSWLGEAFMAFGPYYPVWGLIVGLIIGWVDHFLSKSPELITFDAFVTALLMIYLRSVSQEFIAQVVNSMWILILLYFVRKNSSTRTTRSPFVVNDDRSTMSVVLERDAGAA